ncbi:hypothetical protein DQ238_02900 [Geodermatophilus sp. TF02-6]|nr:hypothetical protein DQ238_02900 [Geodermatophilus sp. TF02-6]
MPPIPGGRGRDPLTHHRARRGPTRTAGPVLPADRRGPVRGGDAVVVHGDATARRPTERVPWYPCRGAVSVVEER